MTDPQTNFLVLATQYSFYMTFAGMLAGAVYFMMERHNLTPKYSAVASLCMMVVAIAAINYATMKDMVGLDGLYATLSNFPTEFRYVDWILTTPLILSVLVMLTNSANKGSLIAKLMVADIIMIASGYAGEVSVNAAGGGTGMGWTCFAISTLSFTYILFVIYSELGEAAGDMPDDLHSSFSFLQNSILIFWIVYPIGYLIPLLGFQGELLAVRELVYCIADLVSKVIFGMIAVSLAKKLSLREIGQR